LTEPEEGEPSLEEKIRILQEEGLPSNKIVERIFEEDLGADVNILASTLQMSKLDIGRIKGRLSRLKKIREEKAKPPTEAPPEEGIYKGETDVNAILLEILTTHPDVPSRVKDEVLSWARMSPGGLHPTQVAYLLSSMKGLSSQTANIVAQKYAFALAKAQQERGIQLTFQPLSLYGPVMSQQPPLGFPTTISFPPQAPSQPFQQQLPTTQQQAPLYPLQTGYGQPVSWGFPQIPTLQDIRNVIHEERAKEKGPKEAETYVDIEIPERDADGKVIIGPDDQPIVKRMHIPASQADQLVPREDPELKFLQKIKAYKDAGVFGAKEELTESKIREIIRSERPTAPEEKPITLEDVTKASAEAAQSAVKAVMEAHEKEDKEETRFRRLEQTIRDTASAKTVEGYKEDSFRFLGQGMHELAQKKPIEVIIKDGGRILFGGSSEKEVEAGAGGAGERLIERLHRRGWVTEQ